MRLEHLPLVNATLNGITFILLIIGHHCIRRGIVRAHACLMISAVICSIVFLTCYVIYHFNVRAKSLGLPRGLFSTCYYVMLFTHVVLAIVMLPMIVMVLMRAARRQWDRHRRLARPTYYIWLYVSATGVLIYLILYHLAPRMYAGGSTGVL